MRARRHRHRQRLTNTVLPEDAMTYLLALDQGTSSSRSIVFDRQGRVVTMAQREFRQIYPQPGWVEHDPRDLWQTQLETAREALKQAKLRADQIQAVGITNQRETTLVWNRQTGEPVYNAIVWQDRRAENTCAELRERGASDTVLQKTGLRIDAYFSGTKLKWILDHVPGAREQAERGELAFGTVDSWLIWQLTGGERHVTDVSNASRTMLFNVHTREWDDELLALLDIPKRLMPEALPSSAHFGRMKAEWLGAPLEIGGVAGDQQSALFGQACFTAGMAKNTYGTGCFMLMHTGERFQVSENGLITTATAQPPGPQQYALEGSVFIGGAVVQWLRDGLKAIEHSHEVEALAASVDDTDGVVLVPAFAGLGAPYWLPHLRGSIQGLTRGSTVAHIARAALESIALQSTVLLQAMQRDAHTLSGLQVTALRVDGGACANNLLMQMQADLMGVAVLRPRTIETTALGAALLAGLHTGVFSTPDECKAQLAIERVFEPLWSRDQAESKLAQWQAAVGVPNAG
jgi:glycerol kinase